MLNLHCTGEVFDGGHQGGSCLSPGLLLSFLVGQLRSDPLFLRPLLCCLLGEHLPRLAVPCSLLRFLLGNVLSNLLLLLPLSVSGSLSQCFSSSAVSGLCCNCAFSGSTGRSGDLASLNNAVV